MSDSATHGVGDGLLKRQKEPLSVVFIGHVDAGKSTLAGNILYLKGMVDQRTMEKYIREARELGRESWYLSWALDTNDEERARGKTVETGRAHFETEKRSYTILDAPGHKNYVPSMIQGAAMADVGILVISARRGEFETGFERGGQTREHALLVKTSGVKKLIVAINKMDDQTVNWSAERFEECRSGLIPFLKKECNYNIKTDVEFIPVSGFTGANLIERLAAGICSFYDGPSLLEILDAIPVEHTLNAPLIMLVADKFSDMGLVLSGKLESGTVRKNQVVGLVPNHLRGEVTQITIDGVDVEEAQAGDTVNLKVKGMKEEEVVSGCVLCASTHILPSVQVFDAQLYIISTERIITAGYQAVMHVHNAAEEVTIAALLHTVDRKTGKRTRQPPRFVNTGNMCIARLESAVPICVDLFKNTPALGRFTLRLNTTTVAMGKVLKIIHN